MPPASPLLRSTLGGRYAPAAIMLGAAAATLGGALLFQYAGGLAPCVLCIDERYPYAVAIAAGLLALFLPDPRARAAVLLVAALAFAVDVGIAGYHIGVERHWWEGTAACTGSISQGKALTLQALREQIMNAPVARCDRISWSLFGLSLAGYNFLIATALAAFSLAAARRTLGQRKP